MDGINNISLPRVPVSLPVVGGSASAAPVLPKPASPAPAPAASDIEFAAEQQRIEAVLRAAQDVANVYIVSDRRFTIFKDSSGQYITRFTDLRSGRVTYIPEPELLKMQSSPPAISLKV